MAWIKRNHCERCNHVKLGVRQPLTDHPRYSRMMTEVIKHKKNAVQAIQRACILPHLFLQSSCFHCELSCRKRDSHLSDVA
jgi:hypothetical protein